MTSLTPKFSFVSVIVLALLGCQKPTSSTSQNDEVLAWHDDYTLAYNLAMTEDKPLFIYFQRPESPAGASFETEVLSDKTSMEKLANYIPLRLSVDFVSAGHKQPLLDSFPLMYGLGGYTISRIAKDKEICAQIPFTSKIPAGRALAVAKEYKPWENEQFHFILDKGCGKSIALEREFAKQFAPTLSKRIAKMCPPEAYELLALSNDVRRRRGITTFHTLDSRLCAAAQNHADYMARTGEFSHYVNNNPTVRATQQGFDLLTLMENIAMWSATPASTMKMWEGSSGHLNNIVATSAVAGFGVAFSPAGMPYWVAMYGTSKTPDPEL